MSRTACPTRCGRWPRSWADRPPTSRARPPRTPHGPTDSASERKLLATRRFRYRPVIEAVGRGSVAGPIVGIKHLNYLHKLHEARSPAMRLLVGALLVALIFAGGFAVADAQDRDADRRRRVRDGVDDEVARHRRGRRRTVSTSANATTCTPQATRTCTSPTRSCCAAAGRCRSRSTARAAGRSGPRRPPCRRRSRSCR